MKAVVWIAAMLLVVALGVNATFMLVSPIRWFALPGWIRATGSLTERKYSSGWGAVQVRLTGAIMLGLLLWVIYDFASH